MKNLIVVLLVIIVLGIGQSQEIDCNKIIYTGYIHNRISLQIQNKISTYPLYIQHQQTFYIKNKQYKAFLQNVGKNIKIESIK